MLVRMKSPKDLIPPMTPEDHERVKALISELEEHLAKPPHRVEISTRGEDSAQIWEAVIQEAVDAGWNVDYSARPRLKIKKP